MKLAINLQVTTVIHLINDKTLIQALFSTFLAASLIAPAVATDGCATCRADLPSESEAWELHGIPAGDVHLNISGISLSADRSLMVVGTDEGAHIQVLKQNGEHRYELIPDGHFALAQEETELDIEGIAGRGSEIWVIGSHSMKRKRVATKEEIEEKEQEKQEEREKKEKKKKEKKAKEGEKKKDKKDKKDGKALDKDYNHQRLNTVGIEPTREWLYRVRLDVDGKVLPKTVVRGSLRDILANHPVLARFRNIPSKENGIDIEGLALMPGSEGEKKTKLLLGFRGPTLRGPLAVVLVVEAKEKSTEAKEKPTEVEEKSTKVEDKSMDDGTHVLKIKLLDTLYLGLDGRGIRGIGEVSGDHGGYLVLAGPVGDAPIPYVLYYWNGKDSVAEIDSLNAADNIERVCNVPPPESTPKAKAEGVQFLDEKDGEIRFLVVYDSGPNGAATAFSCGFRRP